MSSRAPILTMQRQAVKSSNIRSYGFKDNVLEIEYNSGAVYQYSAVPESVYAAMRGAASIGSFVAKSIKGKYKATAVPQ